MKTINSAKILPDEFSLFTQTSWNRSVNCLHKSVFNGKQLARGQVTIACISCKYKYLVLNGENNKTVPESL